MSGDEQGHTGEAVPMWFYYDVPPVVPEPTPTYKVGDRIQIDDDAVAIVTAILPSEEGPQRFSIECFDGGSF